MKWIFGLVYLFIVSTPVFATSRPAVYNHQTAKTLSSYSTLPVKHSKPKRALRHSAPAQMSRFKKAHWFVTGGLGLVRPDINSNLIIYNNSGFPGTLGQDVYTTDQNYQGMIEIGAGRRWNRPHDWFPAYALGLYYQHFFEKSMGNTITQYSTPAFTNYNYTWNVSSDVFLAGLKLNVVHYGRFLPYLTGGLGCSFNKSGNYTETAMPGLTDTRVSAGFQTKTNLQFAYNVGAGLDVEATKTILVSAEYQYQNLGNMSLGRGSGLWSNQSLSLGNYYASTYLLKVTYLIE